MISLREIGDKIVCLDDKLIGINTVSAAGLRDGFAVGHGAAETMHAYLHEEGRGLGRILKDIGDQSIFSDLISHF